MDGAFDRDARSGLYLPTRRGLLKGLGAAAVAALAAPASAGGFLVNSYRLATPATWLPATLDALNHDNPGWDGYTIRQRILSAVIPAAFTQVRFSVRGSSGNHLVVNKAYVGIKGTGDYDFTATPVQATFSGVNSVTVPASTTVFSDAVTLTRTAGQDVVVSLYMSGGGGSNDFRNVESASVKNWMARYKLGDDAVGLTASSYAAVVGGEYSLFLDDFEVMV